jgi:hypothetical protein
VSSPRLEPNTPNSLGDMVPVKREGRPSMADYYSVIATAVSRLPSQTDEARCAIYDRARTALQEALRDYEPTLFAKEQAALDDAIRTLEVINDIREEAAALSSSCQ